MKEKELQLVTFEQAKRLKALGFDWVNNPCFEEGSETPDHYPVLTRKLEKRTLFPAPTVALALKWMRDEKGARTYIQDEQELGYEAKAVITSYVCVRLKRTCEAAESALLDALLPILEEEKQQ